MKFIFIFQKTALHIAVEKGNSKMVQLLLTRKGMDAQIKDEIPQKRIKNKVLNQQKNK